MTPAIKHGGASSPSKNWSSIDWKRAKLDVHQLQMRIAKSARAKRWGKVQALQHLLTRSHQAKLLAVQRVTENQGRNTSGVDGIVWVNAKQKWEAVETLSCRHYRSQPLRRVYIPKKNGKMRPLGIPTMYDRAMQALFLLAYEPVAEVTADHHSYGFRPKRSTTDLYQMFAYGHKYLNGNGELFLIYPDHDGLDGAIKHSFDFDDGGHLKLWVVPFDITAKTIDTERLKLPEGCLLKNKEKYIESCQAIVS